MPYTDDTLKKEFGDLFGYAYPNKPWTDSSTDELADWWLSKFHEYQAYLIQEGEKMKQEISFMGMRDLQIEAIVFNQAIENYQSIIRGK